MPNINKMPPYPGIPYGQAPVWSYPLFEFCVYLLFLFCLSYAWKKGASHVAYLLGGFVFGLLLEYMEVVIGNYTYGHFTVMLGTGQHLIPLCIGISWGIIMYTARLLSDWLGLPLWAAAALDMFLALNIDLSIDVVAYRLHMWHWDWSGTNLNPLTAQWFGIPYGNFFGWQTVVFCYSAFSRIFERAITKNKSGILKSTSVAILALICSLVVLYSSEKTFPTLASWGILSFHRFVGMCILSFLLIVAGWKRKKMDPGSAPVLSWIAPAVFHLIFVGSFFVIGFYLENKWMTIAAMLNLFLGIFLHAWPIIMQRSKQLESGFAVRGK